MTTTADIVRDAFGPNVQHRDVEVLGSSMHWVEADEGRPLVMLHGNPTSSFLWRKVFRKLRGQGRLLAVDLIGFGQSGKPDIEYDLADHERYLDAWFEELQLDDVTLVIQDYGSTLGLSWARRYPDRVRAIVMMEPIIRPIPSAALDPQFVALREQVLQPGVGERIVLEENAFVTQLLPASLIHGLTPEEQAVYEAPFPTPESRKPILFCPRALPVDGRPASTMEVLDANAEWLSTTDVPVLLLTFEPGFLMMPEIQAWAEANIKELRVEHLGAGIHWVQEDQPEAIAGSITGWLQKLK